MATDGDQRRGRAPEPADERRHEPTADPDWCEAWLFDVVQPEQTGSRVELALSIGLTLWPQFRRALFHASLVRPGSSLVSLVEPDAASPKWPSLELRAPGLWTEIGIQTPLEHVTVDLEAFAVELDDPDDVFRGAFGVRMPLGCELEWETVPVPVAHGAAAGYDVPCVVHGELLLGQDVIEIDGWGWRSHRWGTAPVPTGGAGRGRAGDGTWLATAAPLPPFEVIGRAPVAVPDPNHGTAGRLQQCLVRGAEGELVWQRDVC